MMNIEVMHMMNLLLYIHRKRLEKMIENGEDYNKILRQSQILDKYVNKKMKKMLYGGSSSVEDI